MTASELAKTVSKALGDKGGIDVRVLDLGDEASFADFFVIATGTSDRHLQTLAEAATEAARLAGERTLGIEGKGTGRWVLVDLADVIVHLFTLDARDFFGLERLWGEGEPVVQERTAGIGR